MYAAVNSRVKLSDLIQGIIVQSANDACIAIAEGVAGSEPAFADRMTRRAREIGLTRSQWLVLSRLRRRPGATQSELADMLELDRASAGRMLDRMEKGGWIERRADAGDRRVNRLHLTPDAQRVHTEMWEIAEATVDDALATLSATERATFTRLAARVKSRLQALAALDTPMVPAEPVSPLRASERGEGGDTSPPAKRGEREGPAPEAWEGEVGGGVGHGLAMDTVFGTATHLTLPCLRHGPLPRIKSGAGSLPP